MKLSKDNVELGLTSLSNLIDIFSKFRKENLSIRKEQRMQNNTIGLGLNLLSSLTNIAKTDTNIDHNYINTFNRVIDFFYKTYIGTLKSMEKAESMKIFEEIQDILKYNIEIIEAISSSKSQRIISSLKAKRNKIMKEYVDTLKRGENA